MSRTPRRVYTLSEEQYQYLNSKAVWLTIKLKEAISCRQVLDALLGLDVDEPTLVQQLENQLNTPRRRLRNKIRRQPE